MNHLRNLTIKFFLHLLILGIILPMLGRVPAAEIIFTAVLLTVALYYIGDLFFLPAYGPGWTALSDAGIAFGIFWGLILLVPGFSLPLASIPIPSLMIAAVEYIHHLILRGRIPSTRPPENPG